MRKRNDIILVKHCYDINWAKELNNLFGDIFYDPIKFTEKTYLPGRSMQMRYEAQLIEIMRKEKITKAFFINYIDDFSNNFIKAGFVKEIYGILHSSNNQPGDVGTDLRLKYYEDGIVKMANKLFTNSKFLSKYINAKTIPLGLPIDNEFSKPSKETKILFNQRLSTEKGFKKLYEIKDEYRDRFIISSPKGALGVIPKLKGLYKNFYFKIPFIQYKSLIKECGFVVSFAELENFGTSIHECISLGLCPLVMNNENTCHSEVIIDDLLFNTLDELYEKIDNLTNDQDKRHRLILKQQHHSSKYKKLNYLKMLEKHLTVK